VKRAALLSLSLSLALLDPSPALAQTGNDADKSTARTLGQEGQDALDKGNFQLALDLFLRADRLYHAPTLALGAARAQVGLKRLVSAQESYNRMLREGLPPSPSPAFKQALLDAERELAALEPRIPFLLLTVVGATEPRIELDGEPFPSAALGVKRAIDPGKHQVKAGAAGFKEAEVSFEIQERESKPIHIKLERDPKALTPVPTAPTASAPPAASSTPPAPSTPPALPPSSSGARTAGWISLGLGGVGLAVGSVAGLVAMDRRRTLVDSCGGDERCPASSLDARDRFRSAANFSTVGFGVGLLGLAVGIPLLLTSGPSSTTAGAAPCLMGSQLGVCGRM
jgi:hypothetical protein